MQLVNTIEKHRREAGRHVQPPRVDLGDVGQELCDGVPILGDEAGQIAQEIAIADVRERVAGHDVSSRGRTAGAGVWSSSACRGLVYCNGAVIGALTASQRAPRGASQGFSRRRMFCLPGGHPGQAAGRLHDWRQAADHRRSRGRQDKSVRCEKAHVPAGEGQARQLSLQPVAIGRRGR